MIKLSVRMRVVCYPPLRHGKATVIDMLPANIVPRAELIDLYYQPTPTENLRGAYMASRYNRWILQRDDTGGYIVLPENEQNFKMISDISNTLIALETYNGH